MRSGNSSGKSKFALQNGNGQSSSSSWIQTVWQIVVTLFTFVWFLAVIKVFLLGDKLAHKNQRNNLMDQRPIVVKTDGNGASTGTGGVHYRTITEVYEAPVSKHVDPSTLTEAEKQVHVPRPGEWDVIRDAPDAYKHLQQELQNPHAQQYQQAPPQAPQQPSAPVFPVSGGHSPIEFHRSPKVDLANLKPATELVWPPVNLDGSIPADEGSESMPLTGIKVPRFWEPPASEDLFKTGRMVNGHETIFLMIASYRDFQCRETITSAFKRADHPERLFIGKLLATWESSPGSMYIFIVEHVSGAVDQVVDGDIGCLDIDITCEKDPTQMICKYRSQIAVFKMDATLATGPVTARHIGDRMYRGEYFVMQMDAHCLFINHWDRYIITQWKSTHNEMAVLR
jgi:hypothetical protein